MSELLTKFHWASELRYLVWQDSVLKLLGTLLLLPGTAQPPGAGPRVQCGGVPGPGCGGKKQE